MSKAACSLLGVLLMCQGVAEGALVVSSDVTNEVTWTVADNPVQVTKSNFQVTTGAVLTIQPGVLVEVSQQFRVLGTLRALGTETDRIVFSGAAPGAGWGGLAFTRLFPGEPAATNWLSYCDFTNLITEVYVDRQAARFENCRIDIRFTSSSAGFRGYVSTSQYPQARLDLISNEVTIVCKRNTTFSDASGIILDGMPAFLMGNVFHLEVTNVVTAFTGMKNYRSNTEAFRVDMLDNTFTIHCTSTQQIQNIYGITCDAYASGWISNCTLSVTAPRNARGLSKISPDRIDGCDILVTNTEAGGNAAIYGIYFEATGAADKPLILNSRVRVYGQGEYRWLYGIYFQDGGVLGNRIHCEVSSSNSSAYGLTRIYYQGDTEANSIRIVAPPNSQGCGLNLSTEYNPSAVLRARDNIFFMEGGGAGQGVLVTESFGGIFENSHNLVYGFPTLFSNCVAGAGTVTNPPGWADDLFRLDATSPAVDAATTLSWMTNSADFEGDPRIDGPAPDLGADEWFQQPLVRTAWVTNDWAGLQLQTVTGGVYEVEVATNLASLTWSSMGNAVTAQTASLLLSRPAGEVMEILRAVRRRP